MDEVHRILAAASKERGSARWAVALALGLTSWLSDASLMQTLVTESAKIGSGNPGYVHLITTAVLGAGLGGAIARWLASVVE